PFETTEFQVDRPQDLPRDAMPLESHVSGPGVQRTGQKEQTLLLVEDNRELRDYLKESLGQHYNILTANNGQQGLKKAKEKATDIITSDVMMPELDGLELCRIIKTPQELCHIPVILLTAKDAQIHSIEGLEQCADDYIAKPFNLTELIVRIQNIMDNRMLIRRKFLESGLSQNHSEIKLNSYDEK